MAELNQILYTLFLAMLPVFECRGAIPYGIFAGVDLPTTFIVSLIGNVLPVPFLLLFLSRIDGWIMQRSESSSLRRLFVKYVERLRRNSKSQLDRYGFWGLMIFVAVPLPGTGAWTSCVIAYIFGLDSKKAFAAIALGVLEACVIVAVLISVFNYVI
jgi:uncharacterized membrane protein